MSVPCLIQVITLFAAFSSFLQGDLRRQPDNPNPVPSVSIQVVPIYLGIYITPNINQMFHANFDPLFDKIKQNLERNNFPILWLDQISLLKMNVLPRLLYPIQMIPILFNHKIINKLNCWFSSFICCKRRPRIRMSVLQLPNAMGGLDPDIERYQLSANTIPYH